MANGCDGVASDCDGPVNGYGGGNVSDYGYGCGCDSESSSRGHGLCRRRYREREVAGHGIEGR